MMLLFAFKAFEMRLASVDFAILCQAVETTALIHQYLPPFLHVHNAIAFPGFVIFTTEYTLGIVCRDVLNVLVSVPSEKRRA